MLRLGGGGVKEMVGGAARPRALPRMGVEPQMGNDTIVLHNQGDKNMASDSAVTLAACIQAAAALVAADKFGDHTAGYPADAVGQLTYRIQEALGTEQPTVPAR